MIQCWLGGLTLHAAAEYAEKKNPKDRSLQTGQAWRAFLEMFPFTEAKGFRYLLSCLFRFCASDDSPGNSLRRALIPLSIEHHCTGDFFGPKTIQLLMHSQLSELQLSTKLNCPASPSSAGATGWMPPFISKPTAAGTPSRLLRSRPGKARTGHASERSAPTRPAQRPRQSLLALRISPAPPNVIKTLPNGPPSAKP